MTSWHHDIHTPLSHATHNKRSRHTQQLLQMPDGCINFASVIQVCKFAPSGGSKNFLGREKEFWVLNVEFWIIGKADFELLNFELGIISLSRMLCAIRVIRVQYFTTNFTNLTNVVCVIIRSIRVIRGGV